MEVEPVVKLENEDLDPAVKFEEDAFEETDVKVEPSTSTSTSTTTTTNEPESISRNGVEYVWTRSFRASIPVGVPSIARRCFVLQKTKPTLDEIRRSGVARPGNLLRADCAREALDFLERCKQRMAGNAVDFGLLQRGDDVLPYVKCKDKRYVPMQLINEQNCSRKTLSTWEFAAVKFCCRIACVHTALLAETYCDAVCVSELWNKNEYRDFWPGESESDGDENDYEYFEDDMSTVPSEAESIRSVHERFDSDEEYDSDAPFIRRRSDPFAPIFSSSDDDSASDDDGKDAEVYCNWSDVDTPPIIKPFEGPIGGPKVTVDSISSAVALFVNDEFLSSIVAETNAYHVRNCRRFRPITGLWRDVTLSEFKRFLGLVLLTGHVQKDSRRLYWTREKLLETPYFRKTMSRSRFRQIWQAWHLPSSDGDSRLSKIKPSLDYLLEKFAAAYAPYRDLYLHENALPWKGRLVRTVPRACTPFKCGLVVRTVCDASSGYICDIRMFENESENVEDGILSALSKHLGIWHHVYSNSHNMIMKTAEVLLNKKTRVCAKITDRRSLPPCLRRLCSSEHRGVFRRQGDVLLHIGHHQQKSCMITTIHPAKVEKHYRNKNVTVAMKNYEQCTSVKRADQYLSFYSTFAHSTKWTKRCFVYLLNCAFFNAWKIYSMTNPHKTLAYEQFLVSVVDDWFVGEPPVTTNCIKNSSNSIIIGHESSESLYNDLRKHYIVRIIDSVTKRPKSLRCRECLRKKLRSETRYMCAFCKVPLHVEKCFRAYHTSKMCR